MPNGYSSAKVSDKIKLADERGKISPSQNLTKKHKNVYLLFVSYFVLNGASIFPKYKFEIKINEKSKQ